MNRNLALGTGALRLLTALAILNQSLLLPVLAAPGAPAPVSSGAAEPSDTPVPEKKVPECVQHLECLIKDAAFLRQRYTEEAQALARDIETVTQAQYSGGWLWGGSYTGAGAGNWGGNYMTALTQSFAELSGGQSIYSQNAQYLSTRLSTVNNVLRTQMRAAAEYLAFIESNNCAQLCRDDDPQYIIAEPSCDVTVARLLFVLNSMRRLRRIPEIRLNCTNKPVMYDLSFPLNRTGEEDLVVHNEIIDVNRDIIIMIIMTLATFGTNAATSAAHRAALQSGQVVTQSLTVRMATSSLLGCFEESAEEIVPILDRYLDRQITREQMIREIIITCALGAAFGSGIEAIGAILSALSEPALVALRNYADASRNVPLGFR